MSPENEGLDILGIEPDELTDEDKAALEEAKRLDSEEGGETDVVKKVDDTTSQTTDTKADEELKIDWDVFEKEDDPYHKVALKVRDLIGSDPVGDEKHPHHKVVIDNQTAARQAKQELSDARKELEIQRRINELLLDKGVRSGAGIQDTPTGMTYEEAIEEGKLDEYIANTVKSQYDKYQETHLQQQEKQQWEHEKNEFASKHPDVDMDAFIQKHEYHDFDKCLVLDTVESGGGLDKMLADAKAQGIEEGLKKAAANLRGKIGEGETELNNQTGTAKSEIDAEFKELTVDQIRKLSPEEQDVYVRGLQEEMKKGRIPESDIIMDWFN